jgi:protein-disulfide isomerase
MKELLRGRNAVIAAVGLAAVLIAVGLIIASQVGSGGGKKTATGGTSQVVGAAQTIALFKGIPQTLNVLGKASAPVTYIEFADLQCPFCRDYALDALPTLVREYARTGKMKFVFSGMHFIGPDSEKALRAVYAAGLQGHAWEFLDLLYRNQGLENQGWVSDELLRSIGASIPGFDTNKMLADMSSTDVTGAIAVSDQRATQAGVNSTPTFFAGQTGGTLQHLAVSALTPAALKSALAPIVG